MTIILKFNLLAVTISEKPSKLDDKVTKYRMLVYCIKIKKKL